MTGVILCGGQSSRMGSDKGLLKLEAKTWAQTAIDKLDILHIPVKVSVNEQQYPEYAKVFPSPDLVKDNADFALRGPLLGVLSCHIEFPGEDLFILACDMPLMDAALLKELHEQYLLHPEAEAFLYSNNNEPEPLCGIYTARGLAAITEMYHTGKLRKHSMKFVLDHLSTFFITLKEEQKSCFRNFNAHAELNGL